VAGALGVNAASLNVISSINAQAGIIEYVGALTRAHAFGTSSAPIPMKLALNAALRFKVSALLVLMAWHTTRRDIGLVA
jgi:hypothetical protein